MEKLLKKDCQFGWIDECQQCFDTLKQKMVTAPILVFPDWSKEFHVHVDASSIALGAVLAQPGEGNIDHPLTFFIWQIHYPELLPATAFLCVLHPEEICKIL